MHNLTSAASAEGPDTIALSGVDLKSQFLDFLPTKPYCADSLSEGLMIRGKSTATNFRHIQLNGPSSLRFIVHDIDYRGATLAHRDAILPPCNFIAVNRKNGHAHTGIVLAQPVATHSASRPGPLAWAAAIERGMRRRLGADPAYTGLISKNPLSEFWAVEWRRDEPYTLAELDDWLFDVDKRPESSISTMHGLGRNCACFDRMRSIAYREIRDAKSSGTSLDIFQARLESIGR